MREETSRVKVEERKMYDDKG